MTRDRIIQLLKHLKRLAREERSQGDFTWNIGGGYTEVVARHWARAEGYQGAAALLESELSR